MTAIDEIREWAEQFTAAEKRYVTLLGKTRAGAGGSEILALWAWLCRSRAGEQVPARFEKNLQTCLKRLKSLVLDALRMLDQQHSPHSRMLKQMQAARILFEKGLLNAARKQAETVITRARDFCHYEMELSACALLRKMETAREMPDPFLAHRELAAAETAALDKLSRLTTLRHAYDALILSGSRAFSGRDAFIDAQFAEAGFLARLQDLQAQGDWLERNLAGNMLGIREIYQQLYLEACDRYTSLLRDWVAAPERQLAEMNLFLNICKNYQYACFQLTCSPQERKDRLSLIPALRTLPPAFETKIRYLLYREQLAWVMDSAAFEMLHTLRPEILAWLRTHWKEVGESRALAMSFNLASAAFIQEDFSAALIMIALILSKGNKVARQDIREFSIIFQAVMHYELRNDDLNEYLIRSARRKFSRKSRRDEFEMAVLNCLTHCSRHRDPQEKKQALQHLYQDLQALEQKLDTRLQIVGLAEIMIWCEARLQQQTLKTVYLRLKDSAASGAPAPTPA